MRGLIVRFGTEIGIVRHGLVQQVDNVGSHRVLTREACASKVDKLYDAESVPALACPQRLRCTVDRSSGRVLRADRAAEAVLLHPVLEFVDRDGDLLPDRRAGDVRLQLAEEILRWPHARLVR